MSSRIDEMGRAMTRRMKRSRPRVESMEGRTLLTAGTLDASFGGTGQVVTQSSQKLFVQGLAVQADLKTVVAGLEAASGTTGMYPYSLTLARYAVDGSLDPTFGSGGKVAIATNSIKPPTTLHNASVAIQPDGKILVATDTALIKTTTTKTGKTTTTTTAVTSCDMLVLRFNADGSLDSTFGQAGKADIHLPAGNAVSAGIAVLPSGRIVVAGTNDIPNFNLSGPTFVVARLTSSGALDATFGPNGQGYNYQAVARWVGGATSIVNAMAVDAQGNILIGGAVANPSGPGPIMDQVVRYTAGGLVDATFANQGVFDFASGYLWGVEGIGFQAGEQIIVSRNSNAGGYGSVSRLNSNGTVDTTFGSNGSFVDPSQPYAVELAVQPDGKVLLQFSGLDSSGSGYTDIKVDRLLAGGTLDTTFGAGGQVEMHGNHGQPEGIVVGPDGKITGTQLIETTPFGFDTFRLLNDITSNSPAAPAASPSAAIGSAAAVIDPALYGTDLGAAPWPPAKRRVAP